MEEVKESNVDIVEIDESEVPALIHEQFTTLNEYTTNLDIAKKKADELYKKAVEFREKGVHIFKMRKSVEELQENQVALTESNIINTELQKKSLEYQKKLSEVVQYLFGLGVTNITMNRCVVKELKMRLDNASEEEIDEMTRKEILNVVKQLKAQEDLYLKTMEITRKVKEHDNKLTNQEYKDKEHDAMISNLNEENNKLKNTITLLETKQNEQCKTLVFLCIFAGISLLIGLAAILITLIK